MQDLSSFDAAMKDIQGEGKHMAKGVVGMFERPRGGQMMKREDSAVKKAIKSVMQLGKKHAPDRPKIERR